MQHNLPPIELLESTHFFPGPFTFKFIGTSDDGFIARSVSAVREALSLEEDPHYEFKQTANGRHVSLTVEINVLSAHQVHAVYDRLLKVPGIVVML